MTPRSTPLDPLEDSVLIRRGAVQLLRLVQLATELAAAPDLDALLATITQGLTTLLGATRTTLYVYDAKSCEIVTRVADRLEIREIRLPLGKGIAGQVAKTCQLLHVPEVKDSPYFAPEFDKKTGFITRSILASPMLNTKKELVGVVEVLNKKAGTFTEEDEELLRLFASYAAVAIEAAVLEQEMRRRERMAAIGSLAGTIVHDIRNMATLVSGWLDLIQPGSGTADPREVVDVIRGEAEKMVDLTEEILEFARGGDPRVHPAPVDLDRMIADLARVIEREFHVAGVKLELQLGGAGFASLDARRFRRVVFNLAQNARKALRRGGTLIIRTSRQEVSQAGTPPCVKLVFEDDGPGIPAEIRSRLFTPFTSAGSQGGTGLGLAICKSIVDAHGGRITVQHRPGGGTIFEIALPAA
jgi:signal transduction histidine kinase